MMRGDEGCQHYLTLTFEKFLGVLRGYIATMNISLFKKKKKKKKKREIMYASLKVGPIFKTNLTFISVKSLPFLRSRCKNLHSMPLHLI
jgi:hypothetical protein